MIGWILWWELQRERRARREKRWQEAQAERQRLRAPEPRETLDGPNPVFIGTTAVIAIVVVAWLFHELGWPAIGFVIGGLFALYKAK